MSDKRSFSLKKALHEFMSSKWMSRANPKFLPMLDRVLFKVTGGRYTATSLFSGLPLVMVHAIGAKSGKVRSVPLLCIRADKTDTEFALVASNWGQDHLPAWYYNLKANPQVDCTIYGETHTYLASEAEGDDYKHYWSIAERTYIGYPKYQRRARRHIPILIMTPINR